MRKAFTLIELVVAVGLLVMVISFSSVIFRISIESHRTVRANAEIMQKLRAITDQLDNDFRALSKDAPLLIWFEQKSPNSDATRLDQIMFFSAGDFQSTQLYVNGEQLRGNLARIQYGQANIGDITTGSVIQYYNALSNEPNILARRRHIFTADTDIEIFPDFADFIASFDRDRNNSYEHDSMSLSQWKAVVNNQANNDRIIGTCFADASRPLVDFQNMALHMLMSQNVNSFKIQWAYPYTYTATTGLVTEYRWWPSEDPNNDDVLTDSDFLATGLLVGAGALDRLGIYFNMPGGTLVAGWYNITQGAHIGGAFAGTFYPKALKFTFRLYDSQGVIENGRTFTHIVYLE